MFYRKSEERLIRLNFVRHLMGQVWRYFSSLESDRSKGVEWAAQTDTWGSLIGVFATHMKNIYQFYNCYDVG